jgi:predicted DNA-binding transcriptional regulator YafY
MQTSSTLFRQWTLLKAIAVAEGKATVKSLVQQNGVSEKTIRRDLELLRKVGFPVLENVGEFGRKTFALNSTELPRLDLLYDEALALFFCQRAVLPLAGTFFWESAQAAFRKIQASLGPRAAGYVQRMLGRMHQTHVGGAYGSQAELIDQLLVAIEECKATFITYHSSRSTEPLTYDVHPYGLVEHRGSLYLVGHSQQHDEVRHWKVDRIAEADVTKVPFQRPADFDLEKHMAGSFGVYHGRDTTRVRVRFAPAAARYVREKRMHPSQIVNSERDGSALVEWTVSSTIEVKSFVLSFGAAAEVLEPEGLRKEMAAEAEKLLAIYKTTVKAKVKS